MASSRTYPQQRSYNGALIIRIDTRFEEPVVEEIAEPIPREKRVPRYKKQAQYKFDVMNGQQHPLSIEDENYILVTIATSSLTRNYSVENNDCNYYPVSLTGFTAPEIEFISSIQKRPEIDWAIDNSFDGLYIVKEDNPATFKTVFKFAVYMKQAQATFWKLKYHGS